MKAAIKDLRSKFKDNRGDEDGAHMSRHNLPYQNHHSFDPSDLAHGDHSTTTVYSAPSSPVFRHSQPNSIQSPKFLQSETHSSSHHNQNPKHNYRSSIQNMQTTPTTNHHQPNHHQTINHKHIAITKKSGGISATSIGPSSSSSSNSSTSEMNLLQELQQHALFRTPVPYRSVSPPNPNQTYFNIVLRTLNCTNWIRFLIKSFYILLVLPHILCLVMIFMFVWLCAWFCVLSRFPFPFFLYFNSQVLRAYFECIIFIL